MTEIKINTPAQIKDETLILRKTIFGISVFDAQLSFFLYKQSLLFNILYYRRNTAISPSITFLQVKYSFDWIWGEEQSYYFIKKAPIEMFGLHCWKFKCTFLELIVILFLTLQNTVNNNVIAISTAFFVLLHIKIMF